MLLLPLFLVIKVISVAMITMATSVTLWVSFMNVPEVSCSIDISHLVFIFYQMCLQRLMSCQLQCLLNTSCLDMLNILLQWQHMLFCFGVGFGH